MNAGRVAVATLVAGALDIGSVLVYGAVLGSDQARMLASIAAGPFGNGVVERAGAPALGLGVHFALMAAMVAVYALAADRYPEPLRRLGPARAGIGYGLLLYLVMFWIVLPLRWPEVHPNTDLWPVVRMIFSHVVMVGLPIAFILRPRGAATSAGMPAAAAS